MALSTAGAASSSSSGFVVIRQRQPGPREITPDIVHEFIDHIAQPTIITLKDGKQKSRKVRSARDAEPLHRNLAKVMKTAALGQKIDEAPSFHFYQEDTESRPRYYTPEEIRDIRAFFIDRGDQWMADMVEVSCCTGLRRMEIVNMAMGNIPLSSCGNYVVVTPAVFKERQGTQRTDQGLPRGSTAPDGVHSEPVQPQDILPPLAADEGRAVPE